MKKPFLTTTLCIGLITGLTACSENTDHENHDQNNSTELTTEEEVMPQQQEPQQEIEEEVIESSLGNLSGLVGEWTVDAATAGVKLDLAFDEDGSFKQVMGQIIGEGTWEVVDEEHIKITTQNTKGKTWKVSDLNADNVNLTWNIDKPIPKTIPMTRVK